MAGRKPKPTAVKKMEGNPGKRKLNTKEPVPAKGMPVCPDWLMPEAKKEWERLAKLMLQAASEFGLTPSSRSRIVAGNGKAKETEDEMEALLGDSGVFG